MIDNIFHLYQHGKFEKAIDLIDEYLSKVERGSDDFVRYNRYKSKFYYHQGRGDQALYFINEVLEFDSSVENLSLKAIYSFGQGGLEETKQILELINSRLQQLNLSKTDESSEEIDFKELPGLSNYYYCKALIEEFNGNLPSAQKLLEESHHYQQLLDNRYEENIILYKLATIHRIQGDLTKARSYLLESLQIATSLHLVQEMATTTTLIGQDFLMDTNYDEAIPFLEDGVTYWKEQGSPFGIVWALSELAIVNYLSGNHNLALNQYQEILKQSRDFMPAFYRSGHLLNAIIFGLQVDGFEEFLQENLLELEEITQEENNQFITDRYELAVLLINSNTLRIGERLQQYQKLERKYQTSPEAILVYHAVKELIKLLLLEYSITEKSQYKEEILEETDNRIGDLLHHIHLRMGISFELHSAMLRKTIDVLRFDPQNTEILVDLIDSPEQSFTIGGLIRKLDNIEFNTEKISIDHTFEFDKEFHSIPTLKILLYLLPRIYATFSELEKETELSAGHLSGKCKKLEELRLIVKEKKFIDGKAVSTFSISSKGYIDLKNYLRKLSEFLETITK